MSEKNKTAKIKKIPKWQPCAAYYDVSVFLTSYVMCCTVFMSRQCLNRADTSINGADTPISVISKAD